MLVRKFTKTLYLQVLLLFSRIVLGMSEIIDQKYFLFKQYTMRIIIVFPKLI